MFINFLLALLPIIWLIVALTALKWPTWKAAIGSMLIAALLGLFYWHLSAGETFTALLEGWLMALWPIVLVIIAAVFCYNLTVRTGAMENIKQMLTSVTSDRRLLVLLIAWCFGGFMEGMAGFGTAIAIPAGMLVGLGFPVIFSCLVCLIANGMPTPFGSIGIPTVTLANLVGLSNTELSFAITIQTGLFILLCPFLIVMLAGRKGMKSFKGVGLITLMSGLMFLLPEMLVAKFVGAELAVVVGSVCSMATVIVMALKKKPDPAFQVKIEKKPSLSMKEMVISWSPFICIFVLLLLTSKLVPPLNSWLAQFASQVQVYSGPNPNTITFTWINTAGIWIFISALIGGLLQKATAQDFKEVFVATVKQMTPTIITMLAVLSCAKVMAYAGMIGDIAAFCIALTGPFFTFFAPWLGCLGTFVTGSGTSSGLLFGQVQMDAATALNMNPYWVVGLNMLGVGAGKMISPQSIAIALASAGDPKKNQGLDSKLLGKIMPYGLIFLLLMSVIGYVGGLFA